MAIQWSQWKKNYLSDNESIFVTLYVREKWLF